MCVHSVKKLIPLQKKNVGEEEHTDVCRVSCVCYVLVNIDELIATIHVYETAGRN